MTDLLNPVTVAIAVGPGEVYKKYLSECLQSVRLQSAQPDEILVIDDMAHLTQGDVGEGIRIWKCPWRVGAAHATNFGVALAKHNLVLVLASDDKLQPSCIIDCLKTYWREKDDTGYYWLDVEYSDGRIQRIASGPAMVTQKGWRITGGYPLESASGAPDAALMSIILSRKLIKLYHVESTKPPYWYRMHPETDTAQRGPWQGVILETRKLCGNLWKPPTWAFEGIE